MRVFIAVPCPETAGCMVGQLAAGLPSARWRLVPAQARHVTLRFLGEQPEGVLPSAVWAMQAACTHLSAFSVAVRGVGAFPGPRRPEVAWAGCGEGATALAGLVDALDEALAARGFPREARPFLAHLTLARRRPGADIGAAARDLAGLQAAHGSRILARLWAEAVTLYRSDLGPGGPRYSVLARVPLAPATGGGVP